MRLSHAHRAITAPFDDPNLVSCAGLVPVMALADRCGLPALLGEHVKIAAKGGVNAAAKTAAIVAGMVCGADSIDDLDLLRHGGMPRLFTDIRAPSTLGTFLRLFCQAGRRARLHRRKGLERAARGRLDPALGAVDRRDPAAEGSTNSARGAAKLLTDALATLRRAGATGTVLVRADSAYYGHDIIAAARRAGARFSVTARLTPAVVKAITGIDEQAWVPIRYPNAIYDDDEQRWVSDAEVAETVLTAFTGRRKRDHVTARLIVRRVRRLNPRTVPAGQTEAFAVYRYHAVFTDSTEPMLHAEATHRDHAIVEQVIAELKNGPLAHLPSGCSPPTPPGWPAPRSRTTSPAPPPSSPAGRHARTRTATVRAQLIHTPARLAHSAHQQLSAPAPGLALGGRAGRTVPPRPARPTTHSRLTTAHAGPTGDHVEEPDRPAAQPRPAK